MPLAVLLLGICPLAAARLVCPPVNGYSTPGEAAVAVRTDEEALLRLRYWPLGQPGDARLGEPVLTRADDLHAATLFARGLLPDTRYRYEVLVNGETAGDGQSQVFATAPAPDPQWSGELQVALVAGHDPGRSAAQGVFSHIVAREPVITLWLGDNAGLGPAHWDSLGGRLDAYRAAREPAALAPLLHGSQNMAVWSATDYGPPGSSALLWNAPVARDAFTIAWAGPDSGRGDDLFRVFHWGDAAFYLLDIQSHRQPGTVLGPDQIARLLEALRTSSARLHCIVIGCPLASPVEAPERFGDAAQERQRLLDALVALDMPGLLVVSGQPGGTGELSAYKKTGHPTLFELTVGPVTAAPAPPARDLNYLREPGTLVASNQFALLTLTGTATDRSVHLAVFDASGKELWSKRLPLAQ